MIDLQKIIKELQPKCGKVVFIAVDGHGGSGKTTFARNLSKKLNATLIHTDDFSGWDNPLHWWPDVVKKVFTPICDGAETLSYQPASWAKDHHPQHIDNQPVTPIMILEGVSSSRSEFKDHLSLKIFIDTPRELCLQRGVARDLANNPNRTTEETTELWTEWLAEEDNFFEKNKPKQKADIVIDGTKKFEEQICNFII